MCAIIGGDVQATEENIGTICRLFIESRIRGKHATGVSYLKGGIQTIREAVPAEEFISTHDPSEWVSDGRIKFIAHCRYSTSDIRFNQPLDYDMLSIVHNGVVTQDPPEMWGRYGYNMQTSNDSELIWHSVANDHEPLTEFPDSSMAVAELHADGRMLWYRNGKRPLYMSSGFIFSTKDIGVRSGLPDGEMCQPGYVHSEGQNTKIVEKRELILT